MSYNYPSLIPSLPDLLNAREKEGEPGILSHVTNVDKMVLCTLPAKRRFQTYLASLVNRTWLSKADEDRSTLADTRVVFLLTRIEPEGSKVVLAHTRFSRYATLPTLVYGHTSLTLFWIPGSPSFIACVEKIGETDGDGSTIILGNTVAILDSMDCCHCFIVT